MLSEARDANDQAIRRIAEADPVLIGVSSAAAALGLDPCGLGGAMAHAAPELTRPMGRSWAEAVDAGRCMRFLFWATHPTIAPILAGPDGVGLRLDAERVLASGHPVRIHTGIAHRDGRTGWMGVGLPMLRWPVSTMH